ncbi:DUF7504 family protein [Halobellus rarus]|uniref:HalOD1 output domain-containing protein n=1 Tax=Halobellus rarus TaxID=1126237 RepID=A0ABD6CMX5_9EURY|nr:HalOD1 output domain-containing protein [Halobellus rarus]
MDSQTEPVLRPSEGDAPLSTRVATTVAWLEGVEQTALTPLQDVIDVDALQELPTDAERPSVTAGFDYEGYRIDFNSDGTITVDGTPASTDGTIAPGTSVLCIGPAGDSTEYIEWPTYTIAGPTDHQAWLEVFAKDGDIPSTNEDEAELEFTAPTTRQTPFVCGAGEESAQIASHHRLGVDYDHPQPEKQVVRISDCGDLSTLGQRVSDQLAVWERVGANSVVRIHSLAPFLDASALSQLFQFFHLLIGQVAATDTFLQVQCDATLVAERTIDTLDPLFDVVIEFDADGRFSVSI